MKYFYIIANYNKEYAREAEREITEYLQKRGAVCTVQGLVPEDTQCVITIGGDGTLIQAARDLAGRGLPLLGVNRGHLGYLNQVSRQEDITWAMDSLLEDKYQLERRMMIQGRAFRDGELLHFLGGSSPGAQRQPQRQAKAEDTLDVHGVNLPCLNSGTLRCVAQTIACPELFPAVPRFRT